MSRYTGPSCRLCRRESQKLYLKGEKCFTKCTFEKRSTPPGVHGRVRRPSEYGTQLREKQKARRFYGVGERQFRNYFARATRTRGVTGETLMILLERRLDNVVYRAGFAQSRKEARQLIGHGHLEVNGHKVDIPSYLVSPGDVIAVRPRALKSDKFKAMAEGLQGHNVPAWMSLDAQNWKCTILRLPERDEVDAPVDERLIVELYSK
ncbi:MAG TPA: 30S ribosomal protein S4 [Firmicutes bacterium]|nr:30S ribosomal protein S4 [Candidatus Fermentithermobacillaceae bacterium]